MSPGDIVENKTFQGQIDDDKYDLSILGSIDPGTHYCKNQINTICKNYSEESFNNSLNFPKKLYLPCGYRECVRKPQTTNILHSGN